MDTLDYRGSDAGVTVNLADNTALGGHAEGDRITGIEKVIGSVFADILTGGNGADQLFGNGGADHLDGGEGDDRLWGNKGNDVLIGGKGANLLLGGEGNDTFVIRAGNQHLQIIHDFIHGDDRIDLADFPGLSFQSLLISGNADKCTIAMGDEGNGRILLRACNIDELDPTDFVFN